MEGEDFWDWYLPLLITLVILFIVKVIIYLIIH